MSKDRQYERAKMYLGDAVYAELDEANMIRLHTSDGISETNVIYLEPEVFANLLTFARRIGWIKDWSR